MHGKKTFLLFLQDHHCWHTIAVGIAGCGCNGPLLIILYALPIILYALFVTFYAFLIVIFLKDPDFIIVGSRKVSPTFLIVIFLKDPDFIIMDSHKVSPTFLMVIFLNDHDFVLTDSMFLPLAKAAQCLPSHFVFIVWNLGNWVLWGF
jgi:hypothetical protein